MRDYLIIGQGLAGSLLGWELLRQKKDILIVDNNHKTSSSMISAGIINPVTGKRFALTDNFDVFYKHAVKVYQELKEVFDDVFFEEKTILRIFQNESERDHWNRKDEQDTVQQYYQENYPANTFKPVLDDSLGSVAIKKSGFCHAERLLKAFKKYFQDRGVLTNQEFVYDNLQICEEGVRFGGKLFRETIFCEGYLAQLNPWFRWVPFNGAKGEILKVHMDASRIPKGIINKGKWCAPLGQSRWMAGATYDWDRLDCEPSVEAKNQILQGLRSCFGRDMVVLNHRAGVRPVIKDQKAVLGRHPQMRQLVIFNGLGSKGFLTAPLYASILKNYLTKNISIPKDVTISRFKM